MGTSMRAGGGGGGEGKSRRESRYSCSPLGRRRSLRSSPLGRRSASTSAPAAAATSEQEPVDPAPWLTSIAAQPGVAQG